MGPRQSACGKVSEKPDIRKCTYIWHPHRKYRDRSVSVVRAESREADVTKQDGVSDRRSTKKRQRAEGRAGWKRMINFSYSIS
nr:hypothetical protein Iba_chr01bCG10000 [Ipomoea batatas]